MNTNITNDELRAILLLLESTLGSMNSNDADSVVRAVCILLKARLITV